jgi:protein-S-isoprenylcysteine O-methyltransferase Ste14
MRNRFLIRVGNFLFHYRNGLFPLGYLLLFVPSRRLFGDDRLAALAGFAVALAGQLIRVATIGLEYIIRGGKNRQVYAKKLVTGGLFAHCRNPLYVGNILILLGLGLAADSLLFLALGMALFLFAYFAIVAAEEAFLREKFGAEFDEYCEHVNRFLPRLSGLRATMSGMRFNWRRVISAEYGSTFVWLEAFLLATMQNLYESGRTSFRDSLLLNLCALALLVLAGFIVARILKKSGRLEQAQSNEADPAGSAVRVRSG